MPLIESWVKQTLLQTQPVTALVGNRVYPVGRPQGAVMPAIVYRRMRTVRNYHMRGNSGKVETTIRIHAVCAEYEDSKALLDAMRPPFDGKRYPASSFGISQVTIADEADAFEAPQFGDEAPAYIPYLDVQIVHTEQVTSG